MAGGTVAVRYCGGARQVVDRPCAAQGRRRADPRFVQRLTRCKYPRPTLPPLLLTPNRYKYQPGPATAAPSFLTSESREVDILGM